MLRLVILVLFLLVVYLRDREHCRASNVERVHTLEYESNANMQAACDANHPLLFRPNLHPEAYQDAVSDVMLGKYSILQGKNKIATKDANSLMLASDTKSQVWCETPVVGKHDALTAIDFCLAPQWSPLQWKTRWVGSKGAVHPTWAHRGSRLYLTVVSGSVLTRMAEWPTGKVVAPNAGDGPSSLFDSFGHTLMKSDAQLFDNTNNERTDEGEAKHLKYTEFVIPAGTSLYVPPYAWTSFQYLTDDTVVLCSAYSSWGNLVAYGEQYLPDTATSWYGRVRKLIEFSR